MGETTKLLPCPFCGEKEAETRQFTSHGKVYWQVRCEECWATSHGSFHLDEGGAIKAWNTRAPAQGVPSHDILSVIDPWTRGAFTGWTGKTGSSKITLDQAEDHFSLCMKDMMDAVREALRAPEAADAGAVIVPREPTVEMITAGRNAEVKYSAAQRTGRQAELGVGIIYVYRAMLDAAPPAASADAVPALLREHIGASSDDERCHVEIYGLDEAADAILALASTEGK